LTFGTTSAYGTSRRFAAPHQFDSSWGKADMAGSARLTHGGHVLQNVDQ
jgi:hypothetical protein